MVLKNLKNGFCVHSNDGWPNEGGSLVYWSGCEGERLKLDFFNLGLYSLVMQFNGE